MEYWISRRLDGRTAPGARTGVVTTGGPALTVRTDMERRAPAAAGPVGMGGGGSEGEKGGVVPGGGVGLRAVNDAGDLQPGEVRLFSSGGAEILLRADGAVVINGQVFPGKAAGDGD